MECKDGETMELIFPSLRRLLERKKMSNDVPLILCSDQGSRYSSAGYQRFLKEYMLLKICQGQAPFMKML